MLLLIMVMFSVNWLGMQALVTETTSYEFRGIILRSAAEALLFVFICHVFLRTYIELKVLNQVISSKLVIKLMFYLLAVASLYFSLSYMMGKLEPLAITDINKIQIINQTGMIDKTVDKLLLWSIGIFQSFIFLTGWSLIYIFWKLKIQKQKLINEIKTSQYQHLTNQLSPHFLFNTFNSIRALIFENPELAAQTVTQLSELFRKQLQSNIQVQSTLEEELNISNQYLSIEKIRFEERLEIITEIDPHLLKQELPTLTLLTLVENAIKHGITPNITPGQITMKAHPVSDDFWRFEITNTMKSKSTAAGTRTGLKNIKARLKIMHGSNHQFKVQRDPNTFTVTMDLPYA